MRQRYFLIEPKYSDPDTFCCITVGSDRIHASIQIYADLRMLEEIASALTLPLLKGEWPVNLGYNDGDSDLFFFYPTVLPHEGGNRHVRFRIFQEWQDDGAPYRADIRFELSPTEAVELANDLKAWCANPEYTFIWKGD
jgi:hypothetical protein